MFVIMSKRRHRRYVTGGGLFDWISGVASSLPASVARAVGSAGSFLSANKDTISSVAEVIGNVAKAGATTASAVKQIADVVKAKRATKRANNAVSKPLEKELSQKSTEILQRLLVPTPSEGNINARIAGAGFKTVRGGKGLILGPNSPFKDMPILGTIL